MKKRKIPSQIISVYPHFPHAYLAFWPFDSCFASLFPAPHLGHDLPGLYAFVTRDFFFASAIKITS